MNEYDVNKYLGMAVHLMYYYYEDLKQDQNSGKDLCVNIKKRLGDHWEDMKLKVEYGINNFEDCYSKLDHPFLKKNSLQLEQPLPQQYSKEEVLNFFQLFYNKMNECEAKSK